MEIKVAEDGTISLKQDTDSFLENPREYEDDKDILFFFNLMHDMYATAVEGKRVTLAGRVWSVEDIVNYYVLLLNEMERRGLRKTRTSPLDTAAQPLRKALVDYQGTPTAAKLVGEAEHSSKTNEITLPNFFYVQKPARSYQQDQRQNVKSYSSLITDEDFPVYVTKKYGGVNLIIYKEDQKVLVRTETGRNVTDKLPTIVKQVLSLSMDDFVILAELEHWKNGQYQPVESMEAILNTTDTSDDSELVANVYDLVYLERDLHLESIETRLARLDELDFKQWTFGVPDLTISSLNKAPFLIARTRDEMLQRTEFLNKKPGSEGVVTKVVASSYHIDHQTTGQVKLHNTALLDALVLEVVPSSEGSSFVYLVGVRPGEHPVPAMSVKTYRNRPYQVVAETQPTTIVANKGDVLEIEHEQLDLIQDLREGTEAIIVWSPRAIRRTSGVDYFDNAVAKAKKGRVFFQKQITDENEVVYKAARMRDFEDYPDENKKVPYIIQNHYRGRSVHTDLRIQSANKDFLIGWTLASAKPGVIKEPVITMQDAKKWDGTDRLWKIDFGKGQFKPRPGSNTPSQIRSFPKDLAPSAWLKVEGVTGPWPAPGSTKEYPGVFTILDGTDRFSSAVAEYGVQKRDIHEYFLSGGKMKGRFLFRRLKRNSLQKDWQDLQKEVPEFKNTEEDFLCKQCGQCCYKIQSGCPTDEPCEELVLSEDGLHSCKEYYTRGSKILIASGGGASTCGPRVTSTFDYEACPYNRGDRPLVAKCHIISKAADADDSDELWVAIQPMDLTPLVLSKSEVDKRWMPPQGISALPKEVRQAIPREFRYWQEVSPDKSRTKRDSLVAAMKRGDVDIDFDKLVG